MEQSLPDKFRELDRILSNIPDEDQFEDLLVFT